LFPEKIRYPKEEGACRLPLLFLFPPNIGAKQAEPLDSVTGFHFGLFVPDDFNYFLLSHLDRPIKE
jgi:hypothetical protein